MLEPLAMLFVVRARRPREVVNVVLDVAMGRRVVAVVRARLLGAGGADGPAARHRQAHVVATVVGEELRVGVKLMRGPVAPLEHGDLGEPLRDEEVVADGAGARERARNARGPRQADLDLAAIRHRRRERDAREAAVLRVRVVRPHVGQRRQEIVRRATIRARERDRRDVDVRPVVTAACRCLRRAGAGRASTSTPSCASRSSTSAGAANPPARRRCSASE